MKWCRCGQEFIAGYNGVLCPDCAMGHPGPSLSSLGREPLDTHYKQGIGLRLRRFTWGHFDAYHEQLREARR